MAASGMDAQRTEHGRSRTPCGGERRSKLTSFETPIRLHICGRWAGSSSACGHISEWRLSPSESLKWWRNGQTGVRPSDAVEPIVNDCNLLNHLSSDTERELLQLHR